MKTAEQIKLDYFIAVILSGGVYLQTANGLLTMYQMPKNKDEIYLRNKIRTSIKELNTMLVPLEKSLKKFKINCRPEMNKLVDIVSDVASLDDAELKRVNGILDKIKDERRKKLMEREVAA